MSGKRGTAPCGHPGTHVTVNYVTCDHGCDSFETDTPTDEISFADLFACPRCRSDDTEPFPHPLISSLYHCISCGHCWRV